MRSEEYLLHAEIEYWQEMIKTGRDAVSHRVLDEMVQCQAQAKRRLTSLQEKSHKSRDDLPDLAPVIAN